MSPVHEHVADRRRDRDDLDVALVLPAERAVGAEDGVRRRCANSLNSAAALASTVTSRRASSYLLREQVAIQRLPAFGRR
jgi:hypothetical protein